MIESIIIRVQHYEFLLGQEEEFMIEASAREDWDAVNKHGAMIRELEEKRAVACKNIEELAMLN